MKNISPLCTLVAIACFTNMATAMDWQVGGSHVRISNNGIQISYSGQSDGIVEISDRGIRIGQANANTAEQCTNILNVGKKRRVILSRLHPQNSLMLMMKAMMNLGQEMKILM